jgi:hypothetical protein
VASKPRLVLLESHAPWREVQTCHHKNCQRRLDQFTLCGPTGKRTCPGCKNKFCVEHCDRAPDVPGLSVLGLDGMKIRYCEACAKGTTPWRPGAGDQNFDARGAAGCAALQLYGETRSSARRQRDYLHVANGDDGNDFKVMVQRFTGQEVQDLLLCPVEVELLDQMRLRASRAASAAPPLLKRKSTAKQRSGRSVLDALFWEVEVPEELWVRGGAASACQPAARLTDRPTGPQTARDSQCVRAQYEHDIKQRRFVYIHMRTKVRPARSRWPAPASSTRRSPGSA